MSTSSDIVFRGSDHQECEDFVLALKRYAFGQGMDRDDEWVARFAATCIAGDAMRFYETLGDDVQHSWKLLRKALLERYCSSDVHVPAPAAAPTTPANSNCLYTGMIRITVEGQSSSRYLSHAISEQVTHGRFYAKKDPSNALYFKLRRFEGFQPLRMLGRASWLGISWNNPTADGNAELCCFRNALGPPCRNSAGPALWPIWRYGHSTKSLGAYWYKDEGGRIAEVPLELRKDDTDDEVRFFGNAAGIGNNWTKARMEFVPL